MEKLVKCIHSNENFNIKEGDVYKVTSNDNFNTYVLYHNSKNKVSLSKFTVKLEHFSFLYNEEDAVNKIKEILNIDEKDILKYNDYTDSIKYCIRYEGDVLFINIDLKYNLPCLLKLNIVSLNHKHESSIVNYITEDGIKSVCDFVKFICIEDVIE